MTDLFQKATHPLDFTTIKADTFYLSWKWIVNCTNKAHQKMNKNQVLKNTKHAWLKALNAFNTIT